MSRFWTTSEAGTPLLRVTPNPALQRTVQQRRFAPLSAAARALAFGGLWASSRIAENKYVERGLFVWRHQIRDRRPGWKVTLLPLFDVPKMAWLCIQSQTRGSQELVPPYLRGGTLG
jgi:hypothetical protein